MAVDPDHMNKVRIQTDRRLQFVCRKQETAVARNREHLFVRTNNRGRDSPRESDAKRLLTVRNQELARTKTKKITTQIHAEAAHVGAHRHVRRQNLL